MAKPYNVLITNGTGSENILNGEYTVSASVVGYNNDSIDPKSLTVVEGTNEYNLKISATGTLTLHVTEDGTSGGTPVVGAVFSRTDATGTIYGNSVTSDTNGNAVFNNVPFDGTTIPKIYYIQTASADNHEFDGTVQNVDMSLETQTVEISNPLAALRTINLVDANYDNLKIESGTITLS